MAGNYLAAALDTVKYGTIFGVAPRDSQSAEFTCTVETRMPAPLDLVARLGLLPLFLRRHVEEETIKFAADIARKVTGGSLSP